jgi:metal-dependent amidase/aminoacylase/carboxypeptidase family protein
MRGLLEQRIGEIAQAQAATFGSTCAVTYTRGYPSLITHPEQTAVSVAAPAAPVGAHKVDGDAAMITASEDFAFMLESRSLGAAYWVQLVKSGLAPAGVRTLLNLQDIAEEANRCPESP